MGVLVKPLMDKIIVKNKKKCILFKLIMLSSFSASKQKFSVMINYVLFQSHVTIFPEEKETK